MILHRLDGFNTVCRCGNDIEQIFRYCQEDFCSDGCVQRARSAAGHYQADGVYDPRTGLLSFRRAAR